MPTFDYGYAEGDELGRPYDLRLIRRLAAYARPWLKVIFWAVLLAVLSTGMELLLPYLTRSAIDDYIVHQALEVDLGKVDKADREEFLKQATGKVLGADGRVVMIGENDLRGVDPRLAHRIRQAGAVATEPWVFIRPGEAAEAAATRSPALFKRLEGKILIKRSGLASLDAEQARELRWPDVMGLVKLAGLFAAVTFAIFLFGYGQYVLLETAGQNMMFEVRQKLFRHIVSRSLVFFGANRVGKLVTRLTNDVQNLNEMYRTTLVALFQDFFLLLGIVVVLLWLDWSLALVCFTLLPLIAFLAAVFARLARDAFRRLQGQLGRINSRLNETLSGLMVVKLFRAEGLSRREFVRLNQGFFRAGMRQVKVFAVFMPLTEFASGLAVGLILWYGGGEVVRDRVSLGTLVAFLSYMQMFFRPVRDLAEKYNILQNALASAERIFVLMDDDRALPRPEQVQALPGPAPGEVRFDNVSFGYDPARPVVRGVSFTIPPGQTWAVVGPTGAGKTSLVNLLLRFYDPQRGRVLVDGVDLKQVDEAALASRLALVDQDVFLSADTVAENISLGREWVDRASVERASRESGADRFISHLPQGLDTPLGEGARKLSAGQRQLLALARALAGDPAILILDEATSQVDPESERLIQQALPRVTAQRTSLVVAHRLSTVRRADNILVMSRGQVVEQGAHDDLVRAGGLYAKLVRLQEIDAQRPNGGGEPVPGPSGEPAPGGAES